MPQEMRGQSELDQPLDAIVLEVHPAARDGTPPAWFGFQSPAPAQYMVPQRFGMSAILGIMTALAILFGCFRYMEVHPVVYLFFGVQSLLICVAQMFNGQMPRAASAITGAIILPAFLIVAMAFADRGRYPPGFFCLVFGAVPFGAFLGYITGTMAAGIFLVMDFAERYLARPSSLAQSSR